MPPKKRTRDGPGGNETNSAAAVPPQLTPEYLRAATSGQLLGRMLEGCSALEARADPLPSTAYADLLTEREYLTHPSADVQVVTACLLAECFRHSASALPISKTGRASDLLTFLCVTLSRLSHCKGKSSQAQHLRHAVEALAESHGLATLARSVELTEQEESTLAALVETFLFKIEVADDALVSQLATVVCDCITATRSIPTSVFKMLMTAVGAPLKGNAGAATAISRAIATIVLRKHEELIQPVLADVAAGSIGLAIEQIHKADITDDAVERRNALADLAGACKLVPAVASLGADLGLRLFPEVARFLNDDNAEVRLAVVNAFAAAFSGKPLLRKTYTPIYHALLAKSADPKGPVRAAVLRLLGSLLTSDAGSTALWDEVAPILQTRLVDADETIRRQAIEIVIDCAQASPHQFLQRFPSGGELAKRCLDRKPNVRRLAIQRLAVAYSAARSQGAAALSPFSWIPNAVMDALLVDGGTHTTSVSAVEEAVETMLSAPPKAQSALPVRPGEATPAATKRTAASTRSASRAAAKEHPLFDFDGIVGGEGDDDGSKTTHTTFAALTCLVGHLTPHNLDALNKLMEKKAQLRRTVLRLLVLREELKGCSTLESPQAQEVLRSVHRLLDFLGKVTHATEEWNTIFKTKDAKTMKALMQLCDQTCADYVAAGTEVLLAAKGKLSGEKSVAEKAYRFLESALLLQLSIPIAASDFKTAIQLIGKKRAARGASATAEDVNAPVLGAMSALHCMSFAAPHLLRPHMATLIGWIREDAGVAVDEPCASFVATFDVELRLLSVATDAEIGSGLPKAIAEQKRQVIETIGRVCLQSSNNRAAKTACRCLCRLFPSDSAAMQQILKELNTRLANAARQTAATLPITVGSWIRTFQVLCREVPNEVAAISDEIAQSIEQILMIAVRGSTPDDTAEARSRKVREVGLLQWPSPHSTVVDVASKALVAVVQMMPGDRRGPAIAHTLETLIAAFRATKDLGQGTAGASLKRLALDKQLLHLLLLLEGQPTSGTTAALSLPATVFVISEDNADVRLAVQQKIQRHLKKNRGDAAFAAILFMTAIGEDSRATFSHLRALVHDIGEQFRSRQKATGSTLSDQSARRTYLEYALPIIVATLAHHPLYSTEKQNNFIAFQRVFILLFDELFSVGIQAASFLQELLRRLKAHNDALAPESTQTREIADLAAKVMLDLLSQKSVGIDQVKPWPGKVLIPLHLFAVPTNPTQFPAEALYLDPSIVPSHQPAFKVSTITPSRPRGDAGVLTPPAATQSPSRDHATSNRRVADEDESDDDEVWEASPATKRPRLESEEQAASSAARRLPTRSATLRSPVKA